MRLASTEVLTPYDTDEELIDAVRTTWVIEIPRADHERRHALLGSEPGGAYDRFRALHDLMGHVWPCYGFDRDGEFSAWCLQHRYYRGMARWALATELHAHHSVRWTSGELADPKATLVDRRLLRASLAAAATDARTRPTSSSTVTDRPPARSCIHGRRSEGRIERSDEPWDSAPTSPRELLPRDHGSASFASA
jgi:hypothetical protein